METIITFIQEQPLWLLIGAPAVLAALIIIILTFVIAKAQFKRRLKKIYQNPKLAKKLITNKYSSQSLVRKSGLIGKIAEKNGPEIIGLIGADDIWVESLKIRKRKSDFRRVLNYASEKGLFLCFLISLEKKSFAPILIKWLQDTGDFLYMRKLALSGIGEPFSGQDAHDIFKENLDEIREMTGDPEWPSRYFAIKVLLYDSDDRSVRAMWDAFKDPHTLIRKTTALEFKTGERETLYAELLKLSIDDPASEVRLAAWERIYSEFKDLHSLDDKKPSTEQVFHILELLHPDSKDDENFALGYLDSNNLEQRFAAARFLDRCGALKRLCLEVDLGDRETLERNFKLLKKSSDVNITFFLSSVRETQNPASLLICSRILSENGERSLIPVLAKKVFSMFNNQPDMIDLYTTTVHCIAERGGEESLKLLNRELQKWTADKNIMNILLGALPSRGDFVFTGTLLSFLKDPDFTAKDSLRRSLKIMSQPEIVECLFKILKADRTAYHHSVRMEAVKLLGEMELHYCLQTILENLSVLPVEEAKEFTRVLSLYPKKLFNQKVIQILDGPDAKIRAALIAALSASGEKEFLKSIKKSLKDADPDVRIASVWSLVEYQDYRTLNQSVSMLRDPAERVRQAVAKAVGSYGSDESLDHLKEILFDSNEIIQVKTAVAGGLGYSSSLKSMDILIDKLEKDEELTGPVVQALSKKVSRDEIAHIVNRFKDASPGLREGIASVFKAMKETCEPAVVELLKEDIPSLKPFIGEILEKTGHVEQRIRKLSHRDTAIRRESAEFLSFVGTTSAFRGIVLAARDPDEEVRVQVIRALEKLETKEGNEILNALEKDPDKRVRKYTHWALERLKAKSLGSEH